MSLLLSNDDGVHAPGLSALADCLRDRGDMWIIAPNRDRSGVSNCLTLDRPLQADTVAEQVLAVDGTPTDCVHLGTAGIFMPIPERVISGINLGANLGDDVLYSGTVAAAMEGRFLDKPALAVSLVVNRRLHEPAEFRDAALITRYLLELIDDFDVPARTVFNVNIPHCPLEQIKGLRLTFLGQRLRGENPIRMQNPRGKTMYWIGRAGGPVAAPKGSDFHAVDNGYVSLTPIHADMTCRQLLEDMDAPLGRALEGMPLRVKRLSQEHP